MATVALETLGCRANRYDSDAMALELERAGFELVDAAGHADVYIVNTCTVTERTDKQDRQAIRRAHRANPLAAVIATGCYAQVAPAEVAAVDGVQMVVGTAGKTDIAKFVQMALDGQSGVFVDDPTGNLFDNPVTRFRGRTRAALKIQDGCNYNCSFCIIPTARGRARSSEADRLVAHMEALHHEGFLEVVLTGIHLGDYGKDLRPRTSLSELVRRFAEVGPRVRLSSLDPHEVPDDLVDQVAAHANLCRHLHVCVQSGSDRVLRAMRRHYNVVEFERLVDKIAAADADISIGTDVIAGFPSETDAEHAETVALLTRLPLSYIHVFPYSSRKGTHAATLPDAVGSDVIKARTRELLDLAVEKRRAFYGRAVGHDVDVLVETARRGFTDNYIPVTLATDSAVGRRVRVRIATATELGASALNGASAV